MLILPQGWLSVDNNRALTITPTQITSLESAISVSSFLTAK